MQSVGEIFKEAFSDLKAKGLKQGVISPEGKAGREQLFSMLEGISLPTRKADAWRYQSLKPIVEFKSAADFSAPTFEQDEIRIPKELGCFSFDEVYSYRGTAFERVRNPLKTSGTSEPLATTWMSPNVKNEEGEDFSRILATSFTPQVANFKFGRSANKQTVLFHRDFLSNGVFGESVKLEVGEGANLRVVVYQNFTDDCKSAYFSNWCWDVHPRANLEIVKVQRARGTMSSCKVENWRVVVRTHSSVNIIALDVAGSVSKFSCQVDLVGESAQCHLGGVGSVVSERKHQNDIIVHHKARLTSSSQKFFQTAEGGGVAIFNGKVRIERGCIGSSGEQLSRSYLKDDRSQAYTRPELWIDCDDVKCKHGASTIQVDEDEIFYLQSRGIKRVEAIAMLEKSFLGRAFNEAGWWLNPEERDALANSRV